MLTLKEVLEFTNDEYFKCVCICIKPIGGFKIGDYATIVERFENCHLVGHDYVSATKERKTLFDDKNFIKLVDGCLSIIWIELLKPHKTLFGNKMKKDTVYFPKVDKDLEIKHLVEVYIMLPLLLIKELEPDLLLPFSYLISQTLEKIDSFEEAYVSIAYKEKYKKLICTCGKIIDEIKENCLSIYFNGSKIEDSLISEANKQAQILNEATQLKIVTSSFFKDFNSNFSKQ